MPRERVFDLLDDLRRKPVVWINGPAGSGKTSLVSSYLHSRKMPHIWYRLDEGDADISAFFYYLGLGARQAAPRFHKPMPLFAPEYLLGIQVFARRYFEEFYRRLKTPFVVVLDNYHEVPAGSQFHEIMNIGLSTAPQGINVIAISRNQPPQNFARLRANNVIGLLEWEDIRLTEQETADIVRKKVAEEFPTEALSLLHKKTDGWVAGLILFIESSKLEGTGYRITERLTPNEIFEYFANEIFQKADQEVRTLLLKTSFLPSMTASMAGALTGIPSAGRILQRLAENNYFTEERLNEHSSYLYHPLFREFLLSTARETFRPDQIAAIQKKAAVLLIESGYPDEAAELLVQAQDFKGLIFLILDRAPDLISQGRSSTLLEWIGWMPVEISEDSPWILYWKATCILHVAPAESRKLFEQAFEMFDGQDMMPEAFLAWSGAVQTFLFEFNDFGPLDRWTDWLDARMNDGVSFPSAETGARVAAGMVGALAWRRPNHPGIKKWVDTALSLARETPDTNTALRAYTNCAFLFLWMGEFAECGILVEQMRKLIKAGSSSPARLITLKVAEAMFHNSMADHRDQAIRSVREGFQIAEETGVHVFDPTLSIQGLYHFLNVGDLKKVREFLSKMEIFPGNGHTNSSYFLYFSAWHLFLSGDISGAAAAAKGSLDLIVQAGVPISEALIRLTLAQIMEGSDDREEASRQLGSACRIEAEIGSPYLAYLCDMVQAFFSFNIKEDEAGFKVLRRALVLGREKGFSTITHFWRPAVMVSLCMKALEVNIEKEYVRSLIGKLRLVPEEPPLEIESWPWLVRIYTLGRFALVINGEAEKDFSKAKKKPLLLLKALIALGGRDIKEETITDLLWPDAEGDAGHNAFTTTLARLRRLLGEDRTVHLHDGRVSLDNRLCWVDSWLFERLCGRAEALLKKGGGPDSHPNAFGETASKAAALYQGHFLRSDTDEVWSTVTRERLRNKYYRLVGATARYCEQRGDFEEAARHYQKGLGADPLAEEFYQGLMASCIRLGRHAEALLAYQQCKRIFDEVLGIAPSPKTEALREKIDSAASS